MLMSQGVQNPKVWHVDTEGITATQGVTVVPAIVANDPSAPIWSSGSAGAEVQSPEVKPAGVALTDHCPVHTHACPSLLRASAGFGGVDALASEGIAPLDGGELPQPKSAQTAPMTP